MITHEISDNELEIILASAGMCRAKIISIRGEVEAAKEATQNPVEVLGFRKVLVEFDYAIARTDEILEILLRIKP